MGQSAHAASTAGIISQARSVVAKNLASLALAFDIRRTGGRVSSTTISASAFVVAIPVRRTTPRIALPEPLRVFAHDASISYGITTWWSHARSHRRDPLARAEALILESTAGREGRHEGGKRPSLAPAQPRALSKQAFRKPVVLRDTWRGRVTRRIKRQRASRMTRPQNCPVKRPYSVRMSVHSAVDFYANGKEVGAMPPRVSSATTSWQEQSDVLLAFASERLVKDAGAVITGSDLYAAFGPWLSEQGATLWSQRTFRGRVASHGYFRDVKEGKHRWKKLTLSQWGAEARPTADKVRGYRGIHFHTSADERREREAEQAGRGLAVVTGTDGMDLI